MMRSFIVEAGCPGNPPNPLDHRQKNHKEMDKGMISSDWLEREDEEGAKPTGDKWRENILG